MFNIKKYPTHTHQTKRKKASDKNADRHALPSNECMLFFGRVNPTTHRVGPAPAQYTHATHHSAASASAAPAAAAAAVCFAAAALAAANYTINEQGWEEDDPQRQSHTTRTPKKPTQSNHAHSQSHTSRTLLLRPLLPPPLLLVLGRPDVRADVRVLFICVNGQIWC